jgi:O-methyltransferase involved in polyketide biosynthesis
MKKDRFLPVVLSRSKLFDEWTREFINKYSEGEEVTVLGLGCGLDSRFLRVVGEGGGEGGDGRAGRDGRVGRVRWIDVDMEEVIEVRKKVMPPVPEGGDYTMVAADVTGEGWLREVPNDRPTLVICEGLLMYLEMEEVLKLLKRICERFEKGGQILGDVLGRNFIARQERLKTIARTGARMVSAVDFGKELLVASERLRVRDEVRMWQRDFRGLFPRWLRVSMRVYGLVPRYRTISADLRLEF